MYEIYNNSIGVPVGWMIDEGIVSKNNWKQLVYRNQVNVLRRACRGKTALAEYSSLPDQYRIKVLERLGDPKKVLSQKKEDNLIEEVYEPIASVIEFFDSWTFDEGRKTKE